MSFMNSLGPIQYPLWIVLLLTLVQIVRSTVELVRSETPSPLRRHSILVLGTLGACLGVLGTLIGVHVMSRVIAEAGDVAATTAWNGVRVALGPSIVGLFVLGLASVAWLALQYVAGRSKA